MTMTNVQRDQVLMAMAQQLGMELPGAEKAAEKPKQAANKGPERQTPGQQPQKKAQQQQEKASPQDNVSIKRQGDKLIITIDETKDYGPTKSGKSNYIASTLGFIDTGIGRLNINYVK